MNVYFSFRFSRFVFYALVLFLSEWLQLSFAICTGSISSSEYNALQDLFDSTNGNTWRWINMSSSTHWTFPSPLSAPCSNNWVGLECSVVNPAFNGTTCKISALFLPYRDLQGTIPSSIGDLWSLVSLNLNHNKLVGTIPSELGLLRNVSWLALQSNSLTGTIPSSLGNLKYALKIFLNGNCLSGPIPSALGQLQSAEYLYLHTNSLSGTIPKELSRLSAITYLYLYKNSLTGHIPDEFGQLTSMISMYFFYNSLDGNIPRELGQLSLLTYLGLHNNMLSGTLPIELKQLSSMLYLGLDHNKLNGTIPSSYSELSSLTYLYLNSNILSGPIPIELAQLSNLQYLYLYSNSLTGVIPSQLGQLSSMSELWLYGNYLNGTIPATLGQLSKMLYLDLYLNRLTGTIPSVLWYLSNMTFFGLDYNSLTGTISSTLTHLTALNYLYLSENYFTGYIPSEISILTRLLGLMLSGNSLIGPLYNLSQLKFLQVLNATNNQFTGALPDFPNAIQYIDVSNNLLGCNIVSAFQNCTRLEYLSLGGNSFTNSIPEYFRELSKLQYLNLSSNSFVGSISTLDLVKKLESVDLSDNFFTGTLPVEFLLQPSLRSIILFDNCFSGSIPPEICLNPSIRNLVMDSLTSNCGNSVPTALRPVFQGDFVKYFMVGSIPSCIWSMKNLQLLHLSGNGLTGSLGEIPSNNNLQILVLPGNNLKGTIPLSIQTSGKLSQVDLSENKFSGTLSDQFKMPTSGSLDLTVNRLSGRLPTSFFGIDDLNVLDGNLFQCQVDHMLTNDPSSSKYVCGSDDLDFSLIFATFTFVIAILLFAWLRPPWIKTAMDIDKYFLPYIRAEVWLIGISTAIAVIAMMLFLAIKLSANLRSEFSTHTVQYTWVTSATYMHGWCPVFIILSVLFICLLIVLSGVEDEEEKAANVRSINSLVMDDKFIDDHIKKIEAKQDFKSWRATIMPLLYRVTMHILNITAVITVNAIYVYLALSQLPRSLLLTFQIILGSYKLAWNAFAIPWMVEKFHGRKKALPHLVFMSLFSFVGGPFISTFFSDSNCFLYAITGQSKIQSSFEVDSYECSKRCSDTCFDGSCYATCLFQCNFNPQDPTHIMVSTNPPWLYSYQCSSSLLKDYVPVLLFSYIASGAVIPILCLLYFYIPERILCKYVPKWFRTAFLDGTTLAINEESAIVFCNQNEVTAILDGQFIRINLLLNMTVLLTFGIASPMLALVVFFDLIGNCLLWHLLVGRYLELVGLGNRAYVLKRLMTAREEVTNKSKEYLILTLFSGIFWSLFTFDMIADVSGNLAGGLCVLIPLIVPILLWIARRRISLATTQATETLSRFVSGEFELRKIES